MPGLINGILVARFRVPPFIATLGMYGVANGITLNLCQGFPIYFLPPQVEKIGNSFVAYFLPGRGFTFFRRPPNIAPEDLRNLVGIVPVTVLIAAIVLSSSPSSSCARSSAGTPSPSAGAWTRPSGRASTCRATS